MGLGQQISGDTVFPLGWFACSTLVVSGFALSSSVSHFLDWLYQKRANDSLAFSLVSLTVAGHAGVLVFLNRAVTVQDYVLALKTDLSLLFIAQPVFVWLVTCHMRVRTQKVTCWFAGCFLVLLAANLLSANSLMASGVARLLVRTLPGGESYVSPVLVSSPWRLVCVVSTLATSVYCLFIIFGNRRNVERREAIVMAVSVVCLLVTWLQTMMAGPRMLSVVLVSHYAFLAFIMLMGSTLASRYGRQAQALSVTHKALQVSEERFRMLVEKAPDAIVVYDSEADRLVEANANALLLFGCSREELLRPGAKRAGYGAQAGPAPPVERIKSLGRQALNGEACVFEQQISNLQGKEQVCEVRLAQLPSTASRLVRLSFLDITERKEAEKRQLEYQQRLRSLASELALTEERERKRIAAYLHDQVAQELVAARLKLGDVALSAGDNAVVTMINHIRQMLGRAIEDTYSLTFELSMPILNELGLIPAIEWLGERICESDGIRFGLIDDGKPKLLDHDTRGVCFDVVRELLRNVVKHAKASEVTVMTRVEEAQLWVVIHDDGVGFDAGVLNAMIRKDGGFGLFSVRERLAYLGGTIAFSSERGHGATVTLSAPLSRELPVGNG